MYGNHGFYNPGYFPYQSPHKQPSSEHSSLNNKLGINYSMPELYSTSNTQYHSSPVVTMSGYDSQRLSMSESASRNHQRHFPAHSRSSPYPIPMYGGGAPNYSSVSKAQSSLQALYSHQKTSAANVSPRVSISSSSQMSPATPTSHYYYKETSTAQMYPSKESSEPRMPSQHNTTAPPHSFSASDMTFDKMNPAKSSESQDRAKSYSSSSSSDNNQAAQKSVKQEYEDRHAAAARGQETREQSYQDIMKSVSDLSSGSSSLRTPSVHPNYYISNNTTNNNNNSNNTTTTNNNNSTTNSHSSSSFPPRLATPTAPTAPPPHTFKSPASVPYHRSDKHFSSRDQERSRVQEDVFKNPEPLFYASTDKLLADLANNDCLLSIAQDYHIDRFKGNRINYLFT